MSRVFPPPATIGVLGSGQLGRMFALTARRMGYRVHTLSPDRDSPTGQIGDREFSSAYEDLDQVREFARSVDLVTFEFENVPAATVSTVSQYVPVRPRAEVLYVTQNRLREKEFLSSAHLPVAAYVAIHGIEDLAPAAERIGYPCVLKTAGWGYDGKGQCLLRSPQDLESAWRNVGQAEAILESFVDFSAEISVIVARGLDGLVACFPPFHNQHANHILDLSSAPATLPDTLLIQAVEIARAIAQRLELVGVLCVEMFVTRDGRLLVNELAPRPHNSGHLTIEASVTSQFEQQLRAVCGLPLGATDLASPAAMANLLGDLWQPVEPDWVAACRFPRVKLHLYGKLGPVPGRKMGHLTALADDAATARAMVLAARAAVARPAQAPVEPASQQRQAAAAPQAG